MEERTIAGRYRLTDRIGAGGMGVVWRAEDTRLRRIVAVKELLARNGFDADSAKRAVREGRIAARLQHANVIALYDVVEDDERPWLVMEYLPSRSLATVLAERGTLPPDEVRRIGHQLAAGLASAHEAGVIHRDVKPGNVLVTEFGTVKVTDFGTSRVAGEGTLTASGMLVGTPAYLAPEVALGADPGFPSDVFGVGATLYAALEGGPPFGVDGNPILLLHRAAEGKYPPPANAGPLEPILTRLLDRDPANRPTMAEAERMLAEQSAEPATVLAPALPFAAATRIVLPVLDPPAETGPSEPLPADLPHTEPPRAEVPPTAAQPEEPQSDQPQSDQPRPGEPPHAEPQPDEERTAETAAADAPAGAAPAEAPPVDPPPAGAGTAEESSGAPAGAAATTVRDEPAVGAAATTPAATVPAGTPATTPAAAPVAATRPAARPAAAPPATPPGQDGEPGGEDGGRRRITLVAAGLVVLLGIVLVVALNRAWDVPDGGGIDDTTTGAGTSTGGQDPTGEGQTGEGQTGQDPTGQDPTGQPQDPTSGQPTGQSTTAPPTTTTAAQPVGPDQALTDYYALLPGDTATAFTRLTDRFKAGRQLTPAGYQQYWSGVASVTLSEVRVEGDRVVARVTTAYRDGRTEVELNSYALVRVGGGWAVDQQDKIG
ncbi:protein kinase [Actinosynnema sp. NPDC050436]|uniref:serine/threonine-protein kinase n=1 Tax=Actinosynnema sp. NPDC050436 TaxID=3155659 RepID=UPI0033C4FDF1